MRVVDIMLSLPGLLLTITIVVFLGPGPEHDRLRDRDRERADLRPDPALEHPRPQGIGLHPAARSIGASERRILLNHIMPNALTPVIVAATLALATAIVDAAGLGFLGFGPQDPATPEWGAMLTDTYRYLTSGAGFTALFPGIAIVIVGPRLQPSR